MQSCWEYFARTIDRENGIKSIRRVLAMPTEQDYSCVLSITEPLNFSGRYAIITVPAADFLEQSISPPNTKGELRVTCDD